MKFSRLLAAAACGFALFTGAMAQTTAPGSAPMLKIETGMHLGQFRSSEFDRAGHYYLTAAQDRTARLWSMQDGRQLAVLRPPSDGAALGVMGPVALSPDGREAAITFKGGSSNLFIFNTNGAIRKAGRVPGGDIRTVEWTLDGKWLIVNTDTTIERVDPATLSSTTIYNGTYAFDVTARGNSLIFYKYKADGKNQAVHACTVDLSRPCRVMADIPDGFTTWNSLYLTPDGRTAIYSADNARSRPAVAKTIVEVRDVATGQVKLQRDGPLPKLIWDSLGNAYSVSSAGTLRRYSTVDMQEGAIVAQAPDYYYDGFYNDGKFRYIRKNGKTIEVAVVEPGARPQRVATVITTLDEASEPAAFQLQALAARGIRFAPPGKTSNCAFRGASLRGETPDVFARLKPGECPNVLVMPDGGAIQSIEFRLTRFNSQGAVLWDVPHSARWTYGMAPSSDGRWIAVRSEDGTLRLMTAAEGREVLAVFEQGGRWVMATPSGYYDASPGGEELIGWQVNRGPSELADFFPASRFRSQFNRPDVVAKALETGNEVTALAQANAEAGRKPPATSIAQVLPPVVEIVSPSGAANASASPLVVKYTLRSPADAPVTSVRVRINGQALDLPESRNLVATAANATRELSIPIPAQDSEVQVFAENRNGVSTPATLRVSWKGAPAKQQDAFEAKPKLYVLAVGVSDYDNPQYKLGLAAKDAQDFAAALMKQKGALYRDVEVKLLTNKAATQGEVLDGLEWLRKQVTARDVGMLFLAGHGYNDADGVYYFMPVNADLDRLKRTGVVFTEIKNTLSNLAGKALFFVDTCHSGNVLGGGRRAIPQDVTGIINELSSAENGVVVFSSSTGRQFSLEDPAWGNGAFTKALVEGINGKADMNHNGRITHKMLDFYLSERVKELTKGQQTPVTQAPGGVPDFPIAIIR